MENPLHYITFENSRLNPPKRLIEHKYYNRNPRGGNISVDIKNDFIKKNLPIPYSTLEQKVEKGNNFLKSSNNNININEGKKTPSLRKGYSFRNEHPYQEYLQDEYKSFQDNNNQINMKLKPLNTNSQLGDNNQNKNNNDEDINYPSNYSYYEYKHFKKKKIDSKKMNFDNKNHLQFNSTHTSKVPKDNNNDKNNANSSNLKSGLKINNSSSQKINLNEINYYKIKNDKNSILISSASENKKKNITLNNIYNKNIIKSNEKFNNTLFRPTNHPSTPSVNSENIITPIKKLLNKNNEYGLSNNLNNTQKLRFSSSKSYDKLTQFSFLQPKNKNNTPFRKQLDLYEESKNNLSQTIKINREKTPQIQNEFKAKNIIKNNNDYKNDKYNNNITITINDSNKIKNNTKNLHFNTEAKQIIKENIKTHKKLLSQNKKLGEDKKIKEITLSNDMKVSAQNKLKNLSLPKNNIIKSIIYNNKIHKTKKNINKENNNNYTTTIISKKIEKEKDYIKGKENTTIAYDNKTEIFTPNRYSLKQNSPYENNSINNKERINLSKGRIRHEIINKRNNKILDFDDKKAIKKDINNSNNDKPVRKKNTISNISIYINESKPKIINNIDEYKNKINNRLSSNSINKKKNSSTKLIIKNKCNTELDKKRKKFRINNNIFNSISMKKIEPPEKMGSKEKKEKTEIPKIYSNLAKLTINETNKTFSQTIEHDLSEFPRNVSRFDEISKKSETISSKKDDEFDKMQYKGMRQKTYDARRRLRNKNRNSQKDTKLDSFQEQFSSIIYVKASEAFSLAGKTAYGETKINQDSYIIEKNVNGVLNFNIFGVLDGHGEEGHFVSRFVKRYIIHRIQNHPSIKKLDEPQEIYNELKAKSFSIISNIFIDADSQIQKEKFDYIKSGTTIVLVIQLEEHIICANSGDSRAIAIYDEKDEDELSKSKIFHLSYDCKPDLPNEKRRIMESGGVVEKAFYANLKKDEYTPFRVWAKGENYPGLAMSRSIGDMDAKKVGVIPNPQIVEYTIDFSSKYLLICSDGIWEFMSNEEAMKIGNKYYLRNDAIGLCHELTTSAIKLWEKNGCATDDITVLVVFF